MLTIERYRTLAQTARARLRQLGCYHVEVMLGDGFDIPENAGTFDRIIVTAALERIPQELTERLEPGGILLAPVGPQQGTQTLVRLTRTESGIAAQGSGGRAFRAGIAGNCPRALTVLIDRRNRYPARTLIGRVKPLFTGAVFTRNG